MSSASLPWHRSSARPVRTVKTRLSVELLEDRALLSATIPVNVLDNTSSDYDPSTVVVRFRPNAAGPVDGNAILAGTTVGEAMAPLLVPGLHLVHLAPGVSVPKALAAYNAAGIVDYAEPNFHIYLTDTIPNDPLYSQLYGMNRIRAPLAWDHWRGYLTPIVASIDTGVDYNHPDIAPNMWPGIGRNFINTAAPPLDDHGHGTHTSGTMAAYGNNGLGVVGVNWYAQIMALKIFNASGAGSVATAITALNYAVQNGAVVSNNSYRCYNCYMQSFVNALQTADSLGHVFVAGSGNENRNNDTWLAYPASYNVGNVIAVAATTSTDGKASFSNFGASTVHLGAPGVNIVSTWRNGQYATSSGTSMATPHVAGAMALMIDYFGHWGPPELMRWWLMYTTDPVSSMAGITVSGGRLNVARLIFASTGPGGGAPGGGFGGQYRGTAQLVTDALSESRVGFDSVVSQESAVFDQALLAPVQTPPQPPQAQTVDQAFTATEQPAEPAPALFAWGSELDMTFGG